MSEQTYWDEHEGYADKLVRQAENMPQPIEQPTDPDPKLVEAVANQLKLHEIQIVNVGAYDEAERKRRWKVREETACIILRLVQQHKEHEPKTIEAVIDWLRPYLKKTILVGKIYDSDPYNTTWVINDQYGDGIDVAGFTVKGIEKITENGVQK